MFANLEHFFSFMCLNQLKHVGVKKCDAVAQIQRCYFFPKRACERNLPSVTLLSHL